MSNPNLDAVAGPTQTDWLGEIPGGDIPFDQLFAEPSGTTDTQTQTTATAHSEPSAPATPQAPKADYVLETRTGTRYRTLEDAQRGTEEKDTLIENMRQRLIAIGGVDPITGKPVAPGSTPQGVQNPQGVPANYTQDRQRYLSDLISAAESGNPDAYVGTQAKFVFDLLAPYMGPIQEVVKTRAMDAVKQEIPEFDNFRKSEQYKTFLDRFPSFKAAIEGSEQDFRFHEQLPELYRLAYLAAQGSKVPELLQQQAAAQAQHVAQQTPPQVRPVTTSSQMPPPSDTSNVTPSMQTSEGRQALIRQFEQRGLDRKIF